MGVICNLTYISCLSFYIYSKLDLCLLLGDLLSNRKRNLHLVQTKDLVQIGKFTSLDLFQTVNLLDLGLTKIWCIFQTQKYGMNPSQNREHSIRTPFGINRHVVVM